MNELLIPLIFFSIWTFFSIMFIVKYKHKQTTITADKKSFWNNSYVFDSIPSVFPTLGIFCTALGITIGIWNFNITDIQSSIPQLLKGLRLAFIATMAGIIGLIIFQKINAIVQKKIDDDPKRPRKQTDELSAIGDLTFAVNGIKEDNQKQIERLMQSFSNDLEVKVASKLSSIEKEIIAAQQIDNENQIRNLKAISKLEEATSSFKLQITEQVKYLRAEEKATSEKANTNTDQIIKAMSENNKLTASKFDEFSELLRKNNTEALVEVMKTATEQFNSQMKELIDRLVKENFAELNSSVQNLNNWQKENKEHIGILTHQFTEVSENLQISSRTLAEVAKNTNELTQDNGKLYLLIVSLQNVLIDDTKFAEMTDKIDKAITSVKLATDEFEEISNHVNNWANKQSTFNDRIQTVIVQLEDFKNFNGSLWNSYRKEMSDAVNIIRNASTSLNTDLTEINSQFYDRLNTTLSNLDNLIQRFITGRR